MRVTVKDNSRKIKKLKSRCDEIKSIWEDRKESLLQLFNDEFGQEINSLEEQIEKLKVEEKEEISIGDFIHVKLACGGSGYYGKFIYFNDRNGELVIDAYTKGGKKKNEIMIFDLWDTYISEIDTLQKDYEIILIRRLENN